MKEIWGPEFIITAFFVLYLIQPFVEKLQALDGLVWLPLLGLGICAGIFPAYGFRPECIPLLLFAIILNIKNLPALFFSASSRHAGNFRDRSLVSTVPALVFLALMLAIMFVFAPKTSTELSTGGVQIRKIQDKDRGDYTLRIYGANSGGRPVIFLVPPEAGSIPAIDSICGALRDRGFTVISYSRRGFDFPALNEKGRQRLISPGKIHAMWRAFRAGTTLQKANEQGKALEAERLNDIAFLLPQIPALAGNAENTPLILAGYGAGGSALILLSASAGFSGRFSNVRGIAALESRLWSVWQADPADLPETPADASLFSRFRLALNRGLNRLKPRRVTGPGPLPRPPVPLLCLVSSRALTSAGNPAAKGPYQALVATLRNSPGPASLAVIDGAGPLDYTGYPLGQPLFSFLFPGQGKKPAAARFPEYTADLIRDFAAALLEREGTDPALPLITPRQGVTAIGFGG